MNIYIPFMILCLFFLGCAGSPTTGIKPYSWDDPYWKAENYQSKDPESVLLTEGDLERNYREVARIYTEGGPKNKEEAFSLMRSRLAEFGADAVIKVREKKNKNFEGIVVLFD
ncbi:hypothetical protein OAQ34_06990 [Opitutales bacterium]|nr:hypothetical protein [Opitutales bacterium]